MIWLLIVPGVLLYVAIAGFARQVVHTRPSHHCDSVITCEVAAVAWPLVVPFVALVCCFRLGMRLETQRPVRRRAQKEAERHQDLRAIRNSGKI